MKELFTKDTKILVIVIILILGYGFGYVMPPLLGQLTEKQGKISELSAQIIELEKKKAAIVVPQHTETPKTNIPIAIFKSPYVGVDFESSGMDLVYQLLKIIGATGNKITEISMTPAAPTSNAPASSTPASPAPVLETMTKTQQSSIDISSVGTLNVSMSLDCSYISLQNLLQKVSTWDYLAEVKNLSIEPNQSNPNSLTAKLSIDLYIGQ